MLRTAECLGLSNINFITPQSSFRFNRDITKGAHKFLNFRFFRTVRECVETLRREGREVWTLVGNDSSLHIDDSNEETQNAIKVKNTKKKPFRLPQFVDRPTLSLSDTAVKIPDKVALVIGTIAQDTSTPSIDVIEESCELFTLPSYGFSPELTFSVKMALILQTLFLKAPESRGDLTGTRLEEERSRLYHTLASKSNLASYLEYLNNPPPPLEDLRRITRTEE
eukprot:TRINITY_DN7820_c0_g1_i2.p1 TRINITY_DN7820_c0_g1~~TRINITY_DN7820_c0_g1_i2.p1  ORF type:complete len:224 (-),score=32.22 TRINITY_DN7820_c0_g1_i2:123-794(-)